ncbi:MAG: YpdA family putative bacillithiol disulfide reductase [Lentisphaeria bacterium]|nr:YpdA family putative bacillithiol disulfide reductase [Lentisphaeria bacterium]NQZ70868.1 YpdA family putative bacillithiol disulfide reductase [Lentisphaeria bacterium]
MIHDVLIIGAGPSGLSCAIEAQKAKLSYVVIEKGGITDAIRRFPVNMTFFSTPELLEIGDLPFTITGLRPKRVECLEYYRKVVEHFDLNLQLHTTVQTIERAANGVFTVHTDGEREYECRNLVIATGYFDNANQINIPGEEFPHVSHYYDEPYAYAGMNVVVVGGRNSAAETVLELYRHGANTTLVHRGENLSDSIKYWVKPDIENRIKEASIPAWFNTEICEIKKGEVILKNNISEVERTIKADFVFLLTGYRPDETLLRGIGVALDEVLIPAYNMETYETNVEGVYIAGSVACGCETWNIFIENGRAHAKPIITDIRNKETK